VTHVEPRWWQIRASQSRKPATYTCPFCRRKLHAMSPHVLIAPEGDMEQRRHAHAECVRAAGLPTYADWRRTQPRTSIVSRLWRRFGR
jgi:hypothetical protein